MNINIHPHLHRILTDLGQIKDGQVVIDDPIKFLETVSQEMVQLESEHSRLRVILDTTPSTISWINEDMTYEGVNIALAQGCGLEIEDFPGKTIGFYTKNKYFYNFCELLFQSPNETLFQELETVMQEEQKRFWVHGTKYDDGKKAVLIGIDITELKNMEDHISFTEKLSALGEMVAGIVHEINNPLMVIDAKSNRILKAIANDDTDQVEEAAQKIQDTGKKIASIVRGVKSFVRHGNQDPMVEFDLYEIIKDAYSIVEGKLKKVNVTVEVDDALAGTIISCNVTHIFQVFVNLMTNAADAMEDLPHKWIKIGGKIVDEKLYIHVTDAGTGIPKDVASHIFESFFTPKKLGKGTGLGLSLVKRIMEDHGGDVTIDGEAENTTFIVTFPQAA